MKQASPKAGRPKTILSTNRKVQTQKRRRLLIWTLSSSRLKLMVELNQFCRNLLERTEEKRRRIRTGESSQSSAQYKLTVILRRNQYIFNITKNNEFEKSRKVLAAKPIRKSVVLTRARRRKRTASCSGQPWRRRGCLFFILNSATPIQLRSKELCGGFYTKLWYPSKKISVKWYVTVFHRSSFYRWKLNIGSISRCTFQIFHGNVKIVQNERIISVELLSATMRTIDFKAMFVNYFQFWI